VLPEFPRCEHYLLRAFKGWTLAASETAAEVFSSPPLTREERMLREFPRFLRLRESITCCEHLKGWTLADLATAAGVSSLRGRSHGEYLQASATGISWESSTTAVWPVYHFSQPTVIPSQPVLSRMHPI